MMVQNVGLAPMSESLKAEISSVLKSYTFTIYARSVVVISLKNLTSQKQTATTLIEGSMNLLTTIAQRILQSARSSQSTMARPATLRAYAWLLSTLLSLRIFKSLPFLYRRQGRFGNYTRTIRRRSFKTRA